MFCGGRQATQHGRDRTVKKNLLTDRKFMWHPLIVAKLRRIMIELQLYDVTQAELAVDVAELITLH